MLSRVKHWILGLCAVSVVLAGCSGLFSTPEPVTLSFVFSEGEAADYQAWAQEFQEKYPTITIELKSREGLSGDLLLQEDTFTGTQFDLQGWVQQQAVLPLSPFVEQAADLASEDFYRGTLQVFGSQGQLWALPYGVDLLMMYYNKNLFDRYGVPYPQVGWTWSDFIDLAMAVTDVNADQFGYALQYSNEFGIYEPVVFIYQHGGRVFDDLQNPTRATLNEPLNVEAMEWYADLIYDYHIAPTRAEGPQRMRSYPWQGVIEQKYAMWSMMFSTRGGMRWPVEQETNWGMVPWPKDQNAASLGMATGLFIAASTEHPDEAWQWIEFLSHKTPLYQMPARQSLVGSKAYEELVGVEAALAARAALEEAILVNPSLLGFEAAIGALSEALDAIRNGDATPQAALDAAQEKSGY